MFECRKKKNCPIGFKFVGWDLHLACVQQIKRVLTLQKTNLQDIFAHIADRCQPKFGQLIFAMPAVNCALKQIAIDVFDWKKSS